MFLDIHELERHPLDFEEEFPPEVIDLGGEARQRTPLKASGHAEIVEEHHGKHQIITDIRLRGRLTAGLELQCARCVEPVARDITREFELLYRPLGADAGRDELSVTDAEAEIGYYQGEGILLDILLGVVGAFAGGWLLHIFGAPGVSGLNIYSLFVAVMGSVVLLFLYHLVIRKRSWYGS